MSIEVSKEVRVKDETICDSQSISETKKEVLEMKVKEEPIDIEIQAEAEEKFSATEEFVNKISIAFLNEETNKTLIDDNNTINTNQATTSKISQTNQEKSKNPSDKRRYKCEVCNKSCIAPSHLVIHRRTHTGERPFQCDICKKCFSRSNDLKKHKRIHTGERPFECGICKKSFNQLSALTSHRRTHTGEKPYKCDICQKRFSQLSSLNKHKTIHTCEKL